MWQKFLLGLIILAALTVVAPQFVLPARSDKDQSGFSGIYEVVVTSDQIPAQSAKIAIEDLQKGEVQVICEYEGFSYGVHGSVTGHPEQGGALCRFSVSYPGMVQATAEMTITKVADEFLLNGQAVGDYNYQGQSGHLTGQISGRRISTLYKSSQNPLFIAAAVVLGTAILLFMGFMGLRRD